MCLQMKQEAGDRDSVTVQTEADARGCSCIKTLNRFAKMVEIESPFIVERAQSTDIKTFESGCL